MYIYIYSIDIIKVTSQEMAFVVTLKLHFFRVTILAGNPEGEGHNYTVGITPFADLSRTEFSSKYGAGRRLWVWGGHDSMTKP